MGISSKRAERSDMCSETRDVNEFLAKKIFVDFLFQVFFRYNVPSVSEVQLRWI